MGLIGKQPVAAALTADDISDGAVASGKIADGAVTSVKISDDAVTSGKIADDAVTATKIATGAVDTGTDWQSVQTANFTAVAGKGYPINTTSGTITVTLPASPSAGDFVQIVDYAGTFQTNSVTLTASGSDKIKGLTDNTVLNKERSSVTLSYVDATQGWVPTAGVNDGTQVLAPEFSASGGTETTYSSGGNDYKVHTFLSSGNFVTSGSTKNMDFLIVAGGGGGGAGQGGGGGGGGMRVFTATAVTAGTHPVTVGNGGGNGTNVTPPTDGQDSVFAISGGTTYTANGGGYGGSYDTHAGPNAGNSGGSGGGGGSGHVSPGGGGSGNTPSTTPSQGASGAGVTYSEMGGGGGGGGASGVAGATNPAHGGDGTQNDFRTGSNVYYAGGGAGRGASVRNGGQGGGGNSQTAGGTNTGGGGGGGQDNTNSGDGGSGIVVIRYIV